MAETTIEKVRKEFVIASEGFLFKMRWKGGGEMPKELTGMYTSYMSAKTAAEKYLTNRKVVKRKSDGKS